MSKSTVAFGANRLRASLIRFRDDERGAMTFFFLLIFLLMIVFGGIAVDVMRFETRRVALQQTMDRAALAAASLTQTRPAAEVVTDWFTKAGLGEDLAMVEFDTPTVSAVQRTGLNRVTISAKVRSYNFFMGIYSDNDYLESNTRTQAAEGVTNIEVMMVLDITGSMGEPAGMADDPATPQNEAAWTKIQALRAYASEFVTLVKAADSKNGVSIGLVPYAAQVNIPIGLRQRFNAINISSWDGVPNQGVPFINCFEFPNSSFNSTALSTASEVRMAAVADANSTTTTTTNYVAPLAPVATSRACTTVDDNPATVFFDERQANHVLLPTKDPDPVKLRIQNLQAQGNTSIAMGMRWGTALLDQSARPIYTAIGDASVQGRPADNNNPDVRKIIVLMTDGDHVTNTRIVDAYKTGLSPIWRGADGNFAIRFTNGGPALTNGTRPTCAGSNTFFVPHLKPNSDTTCSSASSAGRVAWLATPAWSGSGTVRQLDWSEVWRHVRVSWVARQLYMRSNVSGTNDYNTIMNLFRDTYLSSVTNMNNLLQANCTAARNAGFEVYGIALAAPTQGRAQIEGCASSPKDNYYFDARDGDQLRRAFSAIAADISDLRLTQ